MHKFWTWLIVGLITTFHLQGEFNQPISNFEVNGGYRLGKFNWGFGGIHNLTLGGIDYGTNFKWTQKYNNIKVYQVSFNMDYTTCNNYYIRVNGDIGRIYQASARNDGDVIFTSGSENGSGSGSGGFYEPISRISGKADRGDIYDLEACVGYQFTSNGRRCLLTPVVGWSLNYQHFKMNHGHQTLRGITPLYGHRSELKPRWWGPFIGVDGLVSVEVPCFLLFGKVEFHFSKQYRAKGSWDLDPLYSLNFRDRSKGRGVLINLGGNYKVCRGFFIGVVGEFQTFHAGKGQHHTGKSFDFLFNDDSVQELPIVDKIKFKHAKWSSVSVALTFNFRYWADT